MLRNWLKAEKRHNKYWNGVQSRVLLELTIYWELGWRDCQCDNKLTWVLILNLFSIKI